jgi:hypothetical protein
MRKKKPINQNHKTNNAPDSHLDLVKDARKKIKHHQKEKYYVNVFEIRKDVFNPEKQYLYKLYELQNATCEGLKKSIKRHARHENSHLLKFSEIQLIENE